MLGNGDPRLNKLYSALELCVNRGKVTRMDEFLEEKSVMDQTKMNSQEANTPAFWNGISEENSATGEQQQVQ